MPLVRKRRQRPTAGGDDDDDRSSNDESPRSGPASRRRANNSNQSLSSDEGDDDDDDHDPGFSQSTGNLDVRVKKLVRLALACEYSRQPIRRTDISQKVLESGSRQFRQVFDQAQRQLRERFGMEMVEQPLKERVTVSQRRAALRVEKPSTSSKSWTLATILPAEYRTPTILTPSQAPSSATEATYTAIYTFIISLITLSGGSIPEQTLDRHLRRVNAESYTPLDRTDRLLARMCKDGYLVKHRDTDSGEEVIEYFIGPRGKVEVGLGGVVGLVREVYGFGSNGDNNNDEARTEQEATEFEGKLRRSLGLLQADSQRRRVGDDDDND